YMLSRRLAVVGSSADDGSPQSALVGIATTPHHEVIFDTVDESRKHRNLVRDPRASVVLSGPEEKTLQFEGLARRLRPHDAGDTGLLEIYFGVWPDGRERCRWPNIAHWSIRPTWAPYSDFTAGPLIKTFIW